MRFDTGPQMLDGRMRVTVHRLILPRQMRPQRLDREAMRQMTGATGQNEVVRCDKSLHTQAQRMYREALLEEGAAGVNDRHRRSASPLGSQAGKGNQRTGAHHVRNHARAEQHLDAVFERMLRMAKPLLLVNEFIDQDCQGEGQRQNAAGARPAIGAAQEKIHREEAAEQEQHRRDDEQDDVCKASLPQECLGGRDR
jgi:hypothetical protein